MNVYAESSLMTPPTPLCVRTAGPGRRTCGRSIKPRYAVGNKNSTEDRDGEEAKEASSARKPELEERRLMSAHRGSAGSGRHPATSEMRDLMSAQLGFCAGSTRDPAT